MTPPHHLSTSLPHAGARPAGEAETYARLDARVAGVEMRACNGCSRCATRCVDGIDLAYPEFERLVRAALALAPDQLRRVLGQDKRFPWGEGAVVELCPFLDRKADQCLVYAARPLICRLFGHAPWLPCPTGTVTSPYPEAFGLLAEYSTLERQPLRAWLHRFGIWLPGLPGDAR